MDWFRRFGIPGTCFTFATLAWLYVFLPDRVAALFQGENSMGGMVVGGLAVAAVPAGYVLVNLEHLLYYAFQSCIGVHTTALRTTNGASPTIGREHEAEVDAMLKIVYGDKENVMEKERFMQEWFRKRFDLAIINNTIFLAVALAFLIGIVAWLLQPVVQLHTFIALALAVSSVAVLAITIAHSVIIHSQARRILHKYYDYHYSAEIKVQEREPNEDHS
jgi:hypothetical protein